MFNYTISPKVLWLTIFKCTIFLTLIEEWMIGMFDYPFITTLNVKLGTFKYSMKIKALFRSKATIKEYNTMIMRTMRVFAVFSTKENAKR